MGRSQSMDPALPSLPPRIPDLVSPVSLEPMLHAVITCAVCTADPGPAAAGATCTSVPGAVGQTLYVV